MKKSIKIPDAGVIVERVTVASIDYTVWMCFGNGPASKECKRNCDMKTFKRCELFVEAGDAVAIEDEQD